MSKGDDIQERPIQFAARFIDVSDALPRRTTRWHIAQQLMRSGTAPVAHHAEARGAESPSDFVHQLKLASKELNESEGWLRIVIASKMVPTARLESLLDVRNQRQRIHGASIKIARETARQLSTIDC